MSLSERIKTQRKKAGLSQESVAELVGVSRQAVTKWETGQSVPSTENLRRLAEVLGITTEQFLPPAESDPQALAEQLFKLCEARQERQAALRRTMRKRNLLLALGVAAGYLAIYLAGRFTGTAAEPMTMLAWLIGTRHVSYLYGWLLSQRLFWLCMAVSVIPACFGRSRFSLASLLGFSTGLVVGELCGRNPPGDAYGHGHYGWAMWGCIFLFSLVMGVILERLGKDSPEWNSRKNRLWLGGFALGVLILVLAVRMGMPTTFHK